MISEPVWPEVVEPCAIPTPTTLRLAAESVCSATVCPVEGAGAELLYWPRTARPLVGAAPAATVASNVAPALPTTPTFCTPAAAVETAEPLICVSLVVHGPPDCVTAGVLVMKALTPLTSTAPGDVP